MSGRWSDGDRGGVVTLLSRGVRDTIVVIVPAAVAYVLIAGPIVALLLEYGNAGQPDADLIARTLQGFAVGLPFFSVFQLITRTFYATQDSRTPALINVGAAMVTISVDVVLVSELGWDVPALALGHAASYLFATAVGLGMLRPRLGSLDGARIWGTIVRVIPAAIVMGGGAWLAATGVGEVVDTQAVLGRVLQVGAATAAGLAIYLAAALMLHIQEVEEVKGIVRRRFRS